MQTPHPWISPLTRVAQYPEAGGHRTIADEYCWTESFEMYQARTLRTSCHGFDSINLVAPALLLALGTIGAQMGPMRTEAGHHRPTAHDL